MTRMVKDTLCISVSYLQLDKIQTKSGCEKGGTGGTNDAAQTIT